LDSWRRAAWPSQELLVRACSIASKEFSVALDLITTIAGRAAIAAALQAQQTINVVDVQLSAAAQPVSAATTAIQAPVVTLPATGSVRTTASGPVLHLVVTDDGSFAYDLHALGLRLAGNVLLMAYSQATPIARKAADSALTLSLDLSIDAATAATLVFGDTDFALPAATTVQPGIVRVASHQHALGFEGDSVITAQTLGAAVGAGARHNVWVPPHHIAPGAALRLAQEEDGIRVQRGTMDASGAELRWTLPPVPRGSALDWLSFLRIRRNWPPVASPSFTLTAFLNIVRVNTENVSDDGPLQIQREVAQSFPFEASGFHRFGEATLGIQWPEAGPHLITAAPFEHISLELVLAFTNAVFSDDHGPETDLVAIKGFWFSYAGPSSAPFVY
jgi:hypothetical protein